MKSFLFLIVTLVSIELFSCNLDHATAVGPTIDTISKPAPYRGGYVHNRINLNFSNGLINGAAMLILSVNLSDSASNNKFSLSGGGVSDISNATLTFVHAENALIQKNTIGTPSWRLTFPQYSATDTLYQPYIRAVVIDDNHQTITDYRGYFVGTTAKLDYIAPELPDKMTVQNVIDLFKASVGLKVTISQ